MNPLSEFVNLLGDFDSFRLQVGGRERKIEEAALACANF